MVDVMIDIEGLDTGPRSALMQVSAVAFELKRGKPGFTTLSEFDRVVVAQSCIPFGGTISADTVKWWSEQGFIPSGKKMEGVREALLSLFAWFRPLGDVRSVWARGVCYDITILEHYFNTIPGLAVPWKYSRVKDARTIYNLAKEAGWEEPEFKGTPHNSLDDCRHQVGALVSALPWLGGGR